MASAWAIPTSLRIWVAFFALSNSGVSSSTVSPLPFTPSSRSLLYSFYRVEKNRETAQRAHGKAQTCSTGHSTAHTWSSMSPCLCSSCVYFCRLYHTITWFGTHDCNMCVAVLVMNSVCCFRIALHFFQSLCFKGWIKALVNTHFFQVFTPNTHNTHKPNHQS